MNSIALVFAFLVIAGNARRAQTSVETVPKKPVRVERVVPSVESFESKSQRDSRVSVKGRFNQLRALGSLLGEINPSAGFNPAGLGVRVKAAQSRAPKQSPFMQMEKLTGVLSTDQAIKDSIGLPLAALRVAAGLLMIHHGSEGGFWPANVGTPGFDGFVDFIVKPYFSFLPGDPVFWSAIHDYIEYIGGAFLVAGFLTRPTSVLLTFTMIAAVYFHLASTGLQGFPFGHVENYSYNFEEPALYALIFLLLAYTGSGAFSIDGIINQAISNDEES